MRSVFSSPIKVEVRSGIRFKFPLSEVLAFKRIGLELQSSSKRPQEEQAQPVPRRTLRCRTPNQASSDGDIFCSLQGVAEPRPRGSTLLQRSD